MTVAVANTNLVDSFNTWRLNTNLAATVLSNNVVTVTRAGSAARGGTARGDGHIKGKWSANDLRASIIRGGNTSSISNITITSNTTINARTLTVSANTEFTGNVNFTTSSSDRIILGDISRIRATGGSSGQLLRKTGSDQITAVSLSLRNMQDLSSNSAHLILSSSNTGFSQELNTPDLRFSAGTAGADKFRIYGDGDSTAGDSDLLMQLVSTDGDSNFKIMNNSNTVMHTFSADGSGAHVGRLTVQGLTTNGSLLPSGSLDIGSSSAKWNDLHLDGVASIDTIALGTSAGLGFSSHILPTSDNARDIGSSTYEWRNLYIDGIAKVDTLTVDDNATIAGTLGITGDLTVQNFSAEGNVDLGNATSDTITATGQFDSDLIPATDDAKDLGSSTKEWRNLYVDGVGNIDELAVGVASGQGVSTSLIPKTNGAGSLGSSSREWTNLYIDGVAKIDDLTVDNNATVAGTLGITGVTTVGTLNATAITASGTTAVNGLTATTVTANSAVDLNATLNVDGNTTLNGVTATTVTANGAVDLKSTLNVDGNTTMKGNVGLGDNSSDVITATGTFGGTANFTNLTTSGNMDIGDGSSDTLTITASVDSSVLPTGTVNLGANGSRWASVYATDIVANNITLGVSGQGAGNSLTVYGNLTVTGSSTIPSGGTISAPAGTYTNLTATGTFASNGSTDLGNGASDTISMIGVVDTDIIPTGTRSLGSTSAPWEKLWVNDLDIADDLVVDDDLSVGGDAGVTGTATVGILAVSGASTLNGDVDFDGAITRDGGTVLFDTNGVLNAAGSIATGAITVGMLADANANHSASQTIGSATAVPIITYDKKGRITKTSTTAVAGVSNFAYDATNKRFRITTQSGANFDATIASGSITSTQLDTISGLSAQQYGSATAIPRITVDAKGRVTAASTIAVAGVSGTTYTSSNNNLRVSTADGKTYDSTIAAASATVKGVASFDSGDFAVSSGAVTLKDATTGAVLAIAGTANEVDVSRSNGTVTVGMPTDVTVAGQLNVGENIVVSGNLTVAGTTTTVNSTTVSIADPIFEMGADGSDDNLDRGIIMKYHNGSAAKKAFMGYDDSTSKFVMIADATDTSSVISGSASTLVANIEGNITGNVTGNVGGNVTGNITSSGTSAFSGTLNLNGATVQNASFNLTGALTGNASTATTLQTARNIGGVSFNGSQNINLPGVNATGNQATTGNAATATKLAATKTIGGAAFDGSANIDVKVKTTSEQSSTSAQYLTFVSSSTTTAVQDIKESSNLTFTPSTGVLLTPKLKATTEVNTAKVVRADTGADLIYPVSGAKGYEFKGNANSATQLATGTTFSLDGVITGSIGYDGTQATRVINTVYKNGGGTKISEADINNNSVSAAHLKADSVETSRIVNLNVTTAKLAATAVTEAKIGAGAVSQAKLKSAVTLQILDASGSALKTLVGPGA